MQSIATPEIDALNDKSRPFGERLDIAEGLIVRDLPHENPLIAHAFLPGLYIRTIFMKAGLIITSAIHRTEHPFFIASGDVIVATDREEIRYQGPVHGVTTPGTRRILRTLADTVWTTYHRTDKTDLAEIAKEILQPHENPFLPEGYVQGYAREPDNGLLQ